MASVLLLDPNKATQEAIKDYLVEHSLRCKNNANEAITDASEHGVDIVILELSLAGHSGMEFLYEFRSYSDWQEIPVLVYSNLKLRDQVINSKAWEQLNVREYLYKPESSLKELKSALERALS